MQHNLDQLTEELIAFCEANNLPQMSADELLAEETVPKTLEQKRYLGSFVERWDSIVYGYQGL